MSGFFRSVLSGFVAQSLVNGASKAISTASANRQAAAAMQPVTVPNDVNGVPFYDQRVFGTPGASLYTAGNLSWEAREAGIDGETRVAQELERLAAFYPNTYIFHSVKLPGKMGDIDHLVIQGNKMLLVDSKNWKHDADYNIYHSTFDADYLTRNGEEFVGGEIHLTRQIAEWQVEFMDSSFDVQGLLVVANRKSRVAEAINAPYSFANIDGIETIFGNTFSTEEVPMMHPVMLQRIASLTQGVGQMNQPVMAAPVRVRKPVTTMTKWLVAWSFFNYTVMILLFPLAGLSAIPLLLLTHRHAAQAKAKDLGGRGLLTAVLVFQYILLVGWSFMMFIVFKDYNKPYLD